jgi:hypothetical protein
MNFRTILTAAALLVAPFAAGGAAHAHGSTKPQHGGIVQVTGETMFEMVNKPAGVELYITEHGEDIPSSSASAKLSITSGAAKKEVSLTPAGGNKYVAKGVKVPSGSKVTVTLVDNTIKAKTFATFTVK